MQTGARYDGVVASPRWDGISTQDQSYGRKFLKSDLKTKISARRLAGNLMGRLIFSVPSAGRRVITSKTIDEARSLGSVRRSHGRMVAVVEPERRARTGNS